jgi:hypothetical protein
MAAERSASEPFWARRGRALLAAVLLFLALPMNATATAVAAPMTPGEMLRAIFVAPDRKIDVSHKGIAIAPPPMQTSELQSSSQPVRPAEPVANASGPRFWLSPEPTRKRRRRLP